MLTRFTINRSLVFAVVAFPALSFVAETVIAPDDQHMRAAKPSPIQTAQVVAMAFGSSMSSTSISNVSGGGGAYFELAPILDQTIDTEYDPTAVLFPLYVQEG